MRRRNIVIHKMIKTLPGRNLSAASVNQSVMLAALPWPLGSALSLINHSYWVAAAAWSPWLHAPSSWSSSLLSPYTSRRSAQTDSSFSHLGEKEHTPFDRRRRYRIQVTIIHCESKTSHYRPNLTRNFIRCSLIFKIISPTDSLVNLQ